MKRITVVLIMLKLSLHTNMSLKKMEMLDSEMIKMIRHRCTVSVCHPHAAAIKKHEQSNWSNKNKLWKLDSNWFNFRLIKVVLHVWNASVIEAHKDLEIIY